MTVANFDSESNLLDIDREPDSGKHLPRWTVIVLILVLTCSASFGLGMLAEQSLGSHGVGGVAEASSLSTNKNPITGQIIADSSTRMFYLPWCTQASSISAANIVWFATEQAAEAKGYTAGEGCAGL